MGEAPRPCRAPAPKLPDGDTAHGDSFEPGCAIGGRECTLEMRRVQCGQAKSEELSAVARRVGGQDDRQAGARLTNGADSSKYGHARLRERGQQAAPGQHDRHAVGSRVQLRRQVFDGRPDVDDVAEAVACGASGTFSKSGGIGVDTDEETIRLPPRQRIRKAPVARADIDGDPAAEADQEVSESVIRALEALAANDIHGRDYRMRTRVETWLNATE